VFIGLSLHIHLHFKWKASKNRLVLIIYTLNGNAWENRLVRNSLNLKWECVAKSPGTNLYTSNGNALQIATLSPNHGISWPQTNNQFSKILIYGTQATRANGTVVCFWELWMTAWLPSIPVSPDYNQASLDSIKTYRRDVYVVYVDERKNIIVWSKHNTPKEKNSFSSKENLPHVRMDMYVVKRYERTNIRRAHGISGE